MRLSRYFAATALLALIGSSTACEINNITAPAAEPKVEVAAPVATFSSFEKTIVVININENIYGWNNFHACLPSGSSFKLETLTNSGSVNGEGYGYNEPTTSTACGKGMSDYTITPVLRGNYQGEADVELKFTYSTPTSANPVVIRMTPFKVYVISNGKG